MIVANEKYIFYVSKTHNRKTLNSKFYTRTMLRIYNKLLLDERFWQKSAFVVQILACL